MKPLNPEIQTLQYLECHQDENGEEYWTASGYMLGRPVIIEAPTRMEAKLDWGIMYYKRTSKDGYQVTEH